VEVIVSTENCWMAFVRSVTESGLELKAVLGALTMEIVSFTERLASSLEVRVIMAT
jgi:hypothetical protein